MHVANIIVGLLEQKGFHREEGANTTSNAVESEGTDAHGKPSLAEKVKAKVQHS